MKNDWWNYLQHASVAGSDGVSTTRSKSKYKGGFVNGKNTSEYNHDYYIHNKDKWGVSGQDDINLNGVKPDELSDEDYYKLIAQVKKNIKERTGHDWNPEDANEFWLSMAEEFGLDDYEDDAKNRDRYERIMQGYRATAGVMKDNEQTPSTGNISAVTSSKNESTSKKSSSSRKSTAGKVESAGSSGKSSGGSKSSSSEKSSSGKGSSKSSDDEEKNNAGKPSKNPSTSKKSSLKNYKVKKKDEEKASELAYTSEKEKYNKASADYNKAKERYDRDQNAYQNASESNKPYYRVRMNNSYKEMQEASRRRQELEEKLRLLAEKQEKKK